jgi:molybdenum cofactor cytidylyltransferase
MRLADALEVQVGDVVALVGAGGKTSAMFRLAAELADQGWRVVTTTTTRVAQEELRFAPQQVGFGHGMRLPESLPDQIELYRHVFVFTKIEADNKVRGVRPAWLDENLARASFLDVLIAEADGSRRLPLKAPLPHEPAMPGSATIVLPVAGMDALGQPLDEAHVYGAEIIHRLTGHPLGQLITTRTMAAVLIHPQLGLKGVPPGARIVPLLNKVTPELLAPACEVADFALTDLHIDRVLLGHVQNPDPIWEARRRIGAIVLAAGESQRMGEPKLLLPWKDGTIIRQVCQQAVFWSR